GFTLMSLPVSHFSFRSTNSTAAPGPVSPNQSRKKKSSKNLTALWKWTVRRSAARKLILISATFSMTAPARRLALLHQLRHSSFHPSREIEGIRLWPIFAIVRRGRGSVRRRLDRSQLTGFNWLQAISHLFASPVTDHVSLGLEADGQKVSTSVRNLPN